ncbi:MAG: serine/threonine protein kinase [Pedosphaera sp.]|nr:serine/threonine protein kinase [Pedosphaera sp.]
MIGNSLTHYRITAKLGEGGMGEVYRATDTKLGRDVAIKVLPADFAENADRLRRFEQEAKVLATLNHPNIMTVFDVGEHEGQSYLVSELLEGQTLREVLDGASNRVLPVRKATDYALQIAQGLAAAHGKGVIHRDLKPDNIFVTKDGRVKILDFGLAKLGTNPKSEQSKSAVNSDAPTVMQAQTEPGAVMGTPGYMSPEQVKGIPVDHRSDIFSFGVILYELLSGRRAFRRDTAVETMRAILKEEPIDLEESIPSALRQIVHHCLEKDPEHRFQSARDLSFSLSALSPSSGGSGSGRTPVLPARSSWGKPALAATAALALLAAGLVAGRLLFPTPKVAAWSGVMLGGPELALDPRPSPDGSLVAFQAFDRGLNQVAVMKPETGNWSVLTHTREHGSIDTIAWSADGASIYYDRKTGDSRGIYRVPVLGGDEHLVLDGAAKPQPLPDGTLLAVKLNRERAGQVFRYWPESGRVEDFPVITDIDFGGRLRVDPIGKHAVI